MRTRRSDPSFVINEALYEAAGVRAGDEALVASNGDTRLAAARHSCGITGADYVPELIEQAKERTPVRVWR